jgi:hypothetical protein
VFPDCKVEYYVHVDAFEIALRTFLALLGEGNMDHLVYFSNKKLSHVEHNYTTIECEGLAMVYALQKFRHYFLGGHFKFYIDHSSLKYLVNKPILEGLHSNSPYRKKFELHWKSLGAHYQASHQLSLWWPCSTL